MRKKNEVANPKAG